MVALVDKGISYYCQVTAYVVCVIIWLSLCFDSNFRALNAFLILGKWQEMMPQEKKDDTATESTLN